MGSPISLFSLKIDLINSCRFRLGPGGGFAPAPQFSGYLWFLAKITQISDLSFEILEKWANLRLPLNVQKPKVLQFQGGLRLPSPLNRGSAPRGWTPLRAMPPDPRYRLALLRLPWDRVWGGAPAEIEFGNCCVRLNCTKFANLFSLFSGK